MVSGIELLKVEPADLDHYIEYAFGINQTKGILRNSKTVGSNMASL